MSGLPEIPEAVDISGKFDIPKNNESATVGQFLIKQSDGSSWVDAETEIIDSGLLPVCGQAVYNFALSKKQDVSNAKKLLYIDDEGNITSISIDELKTLLN